MGGHLVFCGSKSHQLSRLLDPKQHSSAHLFLNYIDSVDHRLAYLKANCPRKGFLYLGWSITKIKLVQNGDKRHYAQRCIQDASSGTLFTHLYITTATLDYQLNFHTFYYSMLQDEMLGSVKVEGQWSVLLMDNITTQIMTNICGVSDLLDYGISRKRLLDLITWPWSMAAAAAFNFNFLFPFNLWLIQFSTFSISFLQLLTTLQYHANLPLTSLVSILLLHLKKASVHSSPISIAVDSLSITKSTYSSLLP